MDKIFFLSLKTTKCDKISIRTLFVLLWYKNVRILHLHVRWIFYISRGRTLIALNFYSVFKRLVCVGFFYYYSERMEFKWGNESLCYMLSLISHLTIYQKNRDYIMKPNILKSNISNEYCCIYKILHILCLINNCGIV